MKMYLKNKNPFFLIATTQSFLIFNVRFCFRINSLLPLKLIAHISTMVNIDMGVFGLIKRWSKKCKGPYLTKSLYTFSIPLSSVAIGIGAISCSMLF